MQILALESLNFLSLWNRWSPGYAVLRLPSKWMHQITIFFYQFTDFWPSGIHRTCSTPPTCEQYHQLGQIPQGLNGTWVILEAFPHLVIQLTCVVSASYISGFLDTQNKIAYKTIKFLHHKSTASSVHTENHTYTSTGIHGHNERCKAHKGTHRCTHRYTQEHKETHTRHILVHRHMQVHTKTWKHRCTQRDIHMGIHQDLECHRETLIQVHITK